MGLNASHESGFGPLTLLDGRGIDTDQLLPAELYANERAAADLNATAGQDLTLFYGTTNQTIVHATVAGIVRGRGQGRVREPRDAVHGPSPVAGRVQ